MYEERAIKELSDSIYNFLHPKQEDAIYPPDEYDIEAKQLWSVIKDTPELDESSIAERLSKIFSDSMEQEYTKEDFTILSKRLLIIIQKHYHIASSMA